MGVCRFWLESCVSDRLRLCFRVGETTGRGCSRSRFRDSAIPADVFWKGDRVSQAGPGPVPGLGLAGRQQLWFREEGRVKLLCPPSLPSAAGPKDPEPRAEPHPSRARDLHPPLGACSVQGEPLGPGCVSSLSWGTSLAEHLSPAQPCLPQEDPSPSSFTALCGCLPV